MFYKRLMALICTISMVIGCVAGISVSAAPKTYKLPFADDFEGVSKVLGGNGTLVEEDGNHFMRFYLKTSEDYSGATPQYGQSTQVYFDKLPLNFTLTADIRQEADNTQPFMLEYHTDDENGDKLSDCYGNMVIDKSEFEPGKWYTLCAKKVRGTTNGAVFNATLTERETGKVKQVIPTYYSNISGRTAYNRFMFRIKNTAGTTTHWSIDNVKMEETTDFSEPSRIVSVDADYPTRYVNHKGLTWRFIDHVKGTVDDKTTASKLDDDFIDVEVTPTAYIDENNNILLTNRDGKNLKTNTVYGAYLYADDNKQEGNPLNPSRFTMNNDFETTIRFEHYFYIMYYTGTHRFYLMFNNGSSLAYNDKNNMSRMIEADMGFGNVINLKLSVRDEKWGTIYVNGREIITYELPATSLRSPYIQYTIYKDDCTTNLEIMDAKVTPLDAESFSIVSLEQNEHYDAGEEFFLATDKVVEGKHVTYFVNGVNVGTDSGDGMWIPHMKEGVYDIYAEYEGARTLPVRIFVDGKNAQSEAKEYQNGDREYILEYDYDGSSDNNICVNDGYFTLDFSHEGNALTYRELNNPKKTYTGAENGIGAGRYKVVVTSGYAEVYYNNQFLFSTFLPYTYGEKVAGMDYHGLQNVTKTPSGVKKERYHADWNGKNEFAAYGMDFTRFYSAEFDKLDKSHETFMVYDGEYQAKLTFDETGIYAESQPNDYDVTQKAVLADTFEPGYYRLTVAKGLAQLFRNNEYINSFKCPAVTHKKAVFRNIENPNGTTFVAIKDTDDIYFHSEDFEGNTEYPPLDYWSSEQEYYVLEEGVEDPFTQEIVTEGGNSFLKITDKGLSDFVKSTSALAASPVGDYNLNVSADAPVFRWRAKADGKGEIHFMGRHIQRGVFLSFGYDFDQSKWVLYKYNRLSDNGTIYDGRTLLASTNGSLDTNWHNYEMVMNEGSVKLLCDGAEVLSYSGLENSHGRLGFGVSESATLFVDDIEYSGEGKVSAGVSYMSEYGIGSKDFYHSADGSTIIAMSSNKSSYQTTDKGKTWTPLNVGGGNSILNLMSGGLMHIGYGSSGWNVHRTYSMYTPKAAFESGGTYINGRWGQENMLIEPDWYDTAGYGRSIMPSRIMQVQDGKYKGRIFFTRDVGNTETYGRPVLFYTDADINYDPNDTRYYDGIGAKTSKEEYYPVEWTQSETSFFCSETGINGQEPQSVDMPNDVIRFFERNDCGFLYYADSYDGGVTFGKLGPSQLIAPLCCYSIKRDPDNLDHYYAYFEYEANTSEKSRDGGRPRTRGALTVSYDGMKNWHYLMDVEELTDDWRTSYTPMNHGMKVIDGVVYMSYMANTGYSKIFAVDTTKSKALLRFSQVHDKKEYYTNVVGKNENQHCIIPKTDGNGRFYGVDSYVNTKDGKYDAETLERIFGMTETEKGKFDFFGVTVTVPADNEGYYELSDVAAVFSKKVFETENSFIISNTLINNAAAHQLEGLGVEKDFAETVRADFLVLLNLASGFGLEQEFRRHIEDNAKFLDVSLNEATDATYKALMDNYYYETSDFEKAFAMAVEAEKGKVSGLLLSSNEGFENWAAMAGENTLLVNVENDVAKIDSKGFFGSGREFGTGEVCVPENKAFVLNFDAKAESGCAYVLELGGAEHTLKLEFETGETKAEDGKITLMPDVWTNVKVVVSYDENGRNVDVTLTPENGDAVTASIGAISDSRKKGLWLEFPEEKAATLSLRNVRVYAGKVLDVVSVSEADGKVNAKVELLNDGTELDGGQLFVGVLNGGRQQMVEAFSMEGVPEKVAPYGTKTYVLQNIEIGADGENRELRFYLWSGLETLVPLAEQAIR